MKSKFLTYFNPIGSTKEQQIKTWKELKWKPEEEKLTDFVFRFSQLAHELGYSDEQTDITICVPMVNSKQYWNSVKSHEA